MSRLFMGARRNHQHHVERLVSNRVKSVYPDMARSRLAATATIHSGYILSEFDRLQSRRSPIAILALEVLHALLCSGSLCSLRARRHPCGLPRSNSDHV